MLLQTSEVLGECYRFIWPTPCQYCRAEDGLQTEAPLCMRCIDQLPRIEIDPACSVCGEPADGICALCRLAPLGATRITSIWRYEGVAAGIIQQWKYAHSRALQPFLVRSLAAIIADSEGTAELLIPVPSNQQTLRARREFQLGDVCKGLAAELGIPYSLRSLRAVHKNSLQVALSVDARFSNLYGALYARPENVCGKSILLIDDVITTGSSVFESTRALLAAGASSVIVFSLARSRSFKQHRLTAFSPHRPAED